MRNCWKKTEDAIDVLFLFYFLQFLKSQYFIYVMITEDEVDALRALFFYCVFCSIINKAPKKQHSKH
jgi:hypothetical protein